MRDRIVQAINSKNLDISVFYNHFRDNGGDRISINDFSTLFMGQIKPLLMSGVLTLLKIYEPLIVAYKINIVRDKDLNFIKAY